MTTLNDIVGTPEESPYEYLVAYNFGQRAHLFNIASNTPLRIWTALDMRFAIATKIYT
jgi:hypothetical protein